MSESQSSRAPLDIEEFERRMSAPDQFDDMGEDPLEALARLVDGTSNASAPSIGAELVAAPPRMPLVVPPRAVAAPIAAEPRPGAEWDSDFSDWEEELRDIAGGAALKPVEAAPPAVVAPAWRAPDPAPRFAAFEAMDSLPETPAEPVGPLVDAVLQPASDAGGFGVGTALPKTQDYPVGDDAHTWLNEPEVNWRADEEHAGPPPAVEAKSRRPLIYAGAGVFALLAAVGGGWALSGSKGAKAPPTILASVEPSKVQPAAPVADGSASNTSLFDRGGDKVGSSRVVNNQEQPIDVQAQTASTRVVGLGAAMSTPPQAASATAGGYFPEPKRVKTVSVRPDGSIIEGDAAPARTPPVLAPASAAPQPPVAKPPATVPKTAARAVAPAKPDNVATATPAPQPPKPVDSAPKPAKVASIAPAAATGAGGGFAVQFAATGSEAEARDRVAKVQSQYGSTLDGRKPGVVHGQANGAEVYRVRVGGMTKEAAVALCVKVKSSGGSCFVAAN